MYIYDVFFAERFGTDVVLEPHDRSNAYLRGKAFAKSLKSAETNGLKRCALLLGRQFGSLLHGDALDPDDYIHNNQNQYGGASDYVSDYGGQNGQVAADASAGYGAGGDYVNANGQVASPPNGAQATAAADGDDKWERFKAWVYEQGRQPEDVAATLGIPGSSKSDIIAWAQNIGVGYGGVIDHLTRCWAEDDALSGSSPYANLSVADPVGNPAEIAGGYADWDDFKGDIEAFYAWLERQGIAQAKVAEILEFGDDTGAYSSKLFRHCERHHARLADVQEHIEFELGLTPAPEPAEAQGALA